MICSTLQNQNMIKEIDASKGVTGISLQRLRIPYDVKMLLTIQIKEKQLQGDTSDENIICEKTKTILITFERETIACYHFKNSIRFQEEQTKCKLEVQQDLGDTRPFDGLDQ
ncbi:hypothetical protein NPIL_256291 [Nephila pilipes]|uniref:Uncharacterized protein n=1 Tax=Nephila pilipes TaxID=299642 RepID=A0A8X6QGD6_NEPPI|nr:hypothetical protein NPIL_256291 [Nephila pilipes]